MSKVTIDRELLERAVKADASRGASSIALVDGWKAMEQIRAILAHPTQQGEAVEVVGVRIRTDGFGSYIADFAMGVPAAMPGEVREQLMTVAQHQRIPAASVLAGCKVVPEGWSIQRVFNPSGYAIQMPDGGFLRITDFGGGGVETAFAKFICAMLATPAHPAERHEASNMGQDQAEDCDQETCEPTRCACKQSNAKQDQGEVQSTAARDVLAERRRQIEAEGWTPERDDAYAEGDLAQAAGCYSLYAHCSENLDGSPADWPWLDKWWKPADPRRNLVKAGALILAEIERLDRAALAASAGQEVEK